MKLLPIALFCSPLAIAGAQVQAPIKVACLGDSITYGARVLDRENNAYPAQLGRLLGANWEVRNFGAGGRTLLSDGDTPYIRCEAFAEAVAWQPDVTVLLLGTNDTCQSQQRQNWEHAEHLERDARALAANLLGERSSARVILCGPTPMFPNARGLEEERRADLQTRSPRLKRITAALRAVAEQDRRIEFLDLSSVMDGSMTVDGVHTTPFGARAIARRTAEAVRTLRREGLGLERELQARTGDLTTSGFHGYKRHDFTLDTGDGVSAACILVEPDAPAAHLPWIWRARFFGHQPELDLELLARGYHLAYCDVANLFGGPAALERWDRFYDLCMELGLSAAVTLEGMSRGGLVVLNWAASRPEVVAAIYLDNAVCDFRSWPGGWSGKRSDADWERCLEAYGLTEEQAQTYSDMPLERLTSVAKAGIPMFVVMGSADEVVPPEENGEQLVRRYRELGGVVEVWRKPNSGHHPHGLHPVEPLLRRLLAVTGNGVNPATQPTASAEYRGAAAGWGGGTWWGQLEKLQALGAANAGAKLVFLGDSITQGLTGSSDRFARPDGERIFDRYHGARGALSLGLSGDRTEHLLYRIEHGALRELEPRVIVLAIGVNNVNAAGHTGVETAQGLAAVVRSLLEHEPAAEVLICGPFPAGPTRTDHRRLALDEVHVRAEKLARRPRVTYVDLRALFLDEQGHPNELMRGDHIHISQAGQEAWMAAIEPTLRGLLDD